MGWWIMGTEHLMRHCPNGSRCPYPSRLCQHGCADHADEPYTGPMDDVTVGFVVAYGDHKGEIFTEKVKAGALAVNYNAPVLSENRTVGEALAMLGDCGALIENAGRLFTENAL